MKLIGRISRNVKNSLSVLKFIEQVSKQSCKMYKKTTLHGQTKRKNY